MASGVVKIPQPSAGFFTGGSQGIPPVQAQSPAPAPVPTAPAPVPTGTAELLELAAVVNYLQGHGVSAGLVAQVIAAVLAFKP